MKAKAQQLKQIIQKTGETLDLQNEQINQLQNDMGETQNKAKQLNDKSKKALKNMNKKKAIGGFLSIIGLFGLLWILL